MPDVRLSEKGAKMLVNFEAMVTHVYPDQVGIATVCVGHVVQPGDRKWIDDGVTRDECIDVLKRDVSRFEDAVRAEVKVPISQPMIDAMVSLVFNIGEGGHNPPKGFRGSSVLRYLNEGKYSEAADAFLLWRYANVLQKDGSHVRKPILLGRREAEARLFRSGIMDAIGGSYSEEPTLDAIVAKARGSMFNLQATLRNAPAGIDPEPDNDVRDAEERLVALPPDREEEAA